MVTVTVWQVIIFHCPNKIKFMFLRMNIVTLNIQMVKVLCLGLTPFEHSITYIFGKQTDS